MRNSKNVFVGNAVTEEIWERKILTQRSESESAINSVRSDYFRFSGLPVGILFGRPNVNVALEM